MSLIDKRSEILFCYDIKDNNPNGDPLDENKPRIDEETKINIVTDVRLKRTVRDYLYDNEGFNGQKEKDIFVREIEYEPGNIQDAKLRAEDYLFDENGKKINKNSVELKKMCEIINKNILKECIDIRMFGATIPIEKDKNKKSSITHTGPVQFQMGRSLNKVELKHIKGTGAFASGKEKGQKTFRDEYILPYSFISFQGVINENAAKETQLSNDDVTLLEKAIWSGTKNLISRSKVGQIPRLYLRVEYNEKGFWVGELNKMIKIKSKLRDEEIRDVSDFQVDISLLKETIDKNKNKINKIFFKIDERLTLSVDDKPFPVLKLLENKMEEIKI